jgi:hypothetical protein
MRATEHNVRSHAHTRAFNRAVSNLVGFGEVSAEEVEPDDAVQEGPVLERPYTPWLEPAGRERPPAQTAAPTVVDDPTVGAAPSRDLVYITDVRESLTRNKKTRYTLIVAGGADWPANETSVMTFNPRWADLARECQKSGAPLKLKTKRTDFGLDVASLERVDDQGNVLPLTSDDIPPFR